MIHNHLFFFTNIFICTMLWFLELLPSKGKDHSALEYQWKSMTTEHCLIFVFYKMLQTWGQVELLYGFFFWYFCIFLMIFQSTFLFSHWDCSRPCQTLSRQSVFQNLMSHFFTSFWEMWSLYIYGKKAFTHAKFIHLFILFYTA